MLAVRDDLHAVHEDVIDSVCVRVDARLVARQIGTHVYRAGANGLRIEDDDVGVPAGLQNAALAEAKEFCGHLRELMDRLFEFDSPELAHAVAEHLSRKRKRIDHVEVRAGIGCADHGAVVEPQLTTNFP